MPGAGVCVDHCAGAAGERKAAEDLEAHFDDTHDNSVKHGLVRRPHQRRLVYARTWSTYMVEGLTALSIGQPPPMARSTSMYSGTLASSGVFCLPISIPSKYQVTFASSPHDGVAADSPELGNDRRSAPRRIRREEPHVPNRLAQANSPYLLQHAENPVDWHPWGPEPLEAAKAQDKPIFLSIGYSACHWCHVMAHESFEDPQIAELLNRDFISIKVDREEHPELDQVYMEAVQMLDRARRLAAVGLSDAGPGAFLRRDVLAAAAARRNARLRPGPGRGLRRLEAPPRSGGPTGQNAHPVAPQCDGAGGGSRPRPAASTTA